MLLAVLHFAHCSNACCGAQDVVFTMQLCLLTGRARNDRQDNSQVVSAALGVVSCMASSVHSYGMKDCRVCSQGDDARQEMLQRLGHAPINVDGMLISFVPHPCATPLITKSNLYTETASQCTRQFCRSQLMDDKATRNHFPADTVKRAKEYLDAIGSTGAYTESQGAEIFRQQIAAVCPPAD